MLCQLLSFGEKSGTCICNLLCETVWYFVFLAEFPVSVMISTYSYL